MEHTPMDVHYTDQHYLPPGKGCGSGSLIICNLGSGSVINSGSKLSSVSIQSCKNVQIFKHYLFLRCSDDLQLVCIFHKQSGSKIFHKQSGPGSESGTGSEYEVKVKAGSGSEKKKFGSTTLPLDPDPRF